jgi:hypothetical protein
LDSFPDHDAIIDAFRAQPYAVLGMPPAAALDVAEMLVGLGRSAEAREILEQYVSQPVHPAHADYLTEYLPRVGHADLVCRVTARHRPPR